MESIRKRNWKNTLKWVLYAACLLLCTVLQTIPGFLQIGQAKPLFILSLCLAVAVFEGDFYGGLFGTVGGLLWDFTAGRTAGMLAIGLLVLCFFAGMLTQLFLKTAAVNFFLMNMGAFWLLLSVDFLFFYAMPGYAAPGGRYLVYVVPTVVFSALLSVPVFYLVRYLHTKLQPDE